MSASVVGRRYARRVSESRMCFAQASCSALVLSEVEGQLKMRLRLGAFPGAVAPYGPLMVTSVSAGSVPRLRMRGRSVDSSRTSSRSMNAMPTSLGPALTGIRKSMGLSRAASPPRPGADRDDLRALAVHGDFELMRFGGRGRDLDSEQVFAVDGEGGLRGDAAAGAPGQIVAARALPLF